MTAMWASQCEDGRGSDIKIEICKSNNQLAATKATGSQKSGNNPLMEKKQQQHWLAKISGS